jgi:hypothetical protein
MLFNLNYIPEQKHEKIRWFAQHIKHVPTCVYGNENLGLLPR